STSSSHCLLEILRSLHYSCPRVRASSCFSFPRGGPAMNGSRWYRLRRRVGVGGLGLAAFWVLWALAPGLPVRAGPRVQAEVRQVGLNLFVHEWQPRDPLAHADGLGPVFNAKSCVACHFQGGVGGGGGPRDDVLAYEALPTPARPVVQTGLIHKFAVD